MRPAPPSSAPFPYTTLFRSERLPRGLQVRRLARAQQRVDLLQRLGLGVRRILEQRVFDQGRLAPPSGQQHVHRSEEHTSELQSHHDLVCRLLLEKKNISSTH